MVLEARLPGSRCWQLCFFLCPLSLACRQLPSCCVLIWSFLSECLSVCPLKYTSQIGLTLKTSFNLNDFCKVPVSKYSHILRYWGLGLQLLNLGEGKYSSFHNREKEKLSFFLFLCRGALSASVLKHKAGKV